MHVMENAELNGEDAEKIVTKLEEVRIYTHIDR